MTGFVIAAICAVLCILNFYLGFVRPPIVLRRYPQTAAIVFFFLTLFSAYFGWRELRSVDELAALIDPVPEVVAVLYVPTPGEMQTIANAMAATPGTTPTGNTRDERRQFAKNVEDVRTRHWRLDTTMSPDSVIGFYRQQTHRRDWEITSDSPPFLSLERGVETLMIYTSRDRLRSITEVWYMYKQGSD